jgi:hypothetical protein
MELLWVMVVGVFLGGCALWNNHKQEWRDKIAARTAATMTICYQMMTMSYSTF